MAENTDTPFVSVYEHVFSAVESDTVLGSLILVGNRISFQDKNHPEKSALQVVDFPQMVLEPGNIEISLFDSNRTGSFNLSYDLYMQTSQYRLDHDKALHVILWRVVKALSRASLTLPGTPTGVQLLDVMVNNFNPQKFDEDDDDMNRGIRGWVGIFTVVCPVLIQRSVIDG